VAVIGWLPLTIQSLLYKITSKANYTGALPTPPAWCSAKGNKHSG